MIYGVAVVRNEADLISICLRHHLDHEGLDRILIVDNGSRDGTREAIDRMRDPRIAVETHAGQFRQSDIVTGLARRAAREGASWIVPFDADELWHAPGGLAATLRAMTDADSIEVKVDNFVQRRRQGRRDPMSMLDVLHRPRPVGGPEDAMGLVMSEECSYIESHYPPKYLTRAKPDLFIGAGNHIPQSHSNSVTSATIRCLHVPLRAKEILRNKVEQAGRLDEAGFPLPEGWHLRRFAVVAERGHLDREWAANSEERGHLETARGRVPLQYDPIVADLLTPLLAPRLAAVFPKRLAARLARLWNGRRPGLAG